MRRYLYSNLFRMIFSSLLIIAFFPSFFYFVCSLLIHKSLHMATLKSILLYLLLRVFLELSIFVLNKKANNSVVFEEGKILYKDRTLYSSNTSIKYFKFYMPITEPSLVIPKIHMNSNDLSVTCYLSKKDVKKLEKSGFEIRKI